MDSHTANGHLIDTSLTSPVKYETQTSRIFVYLGLARIPTTQPQLKERQAPDIAWNQCRELVSGSIKNDPGSFMADIKDRGTFPTIQPQLTEKQAPNIAWSQIFA